MKNILFLILFLVSANCRADGEANDLFNSAKEGFLWRVKHLLKENPDLIRSKDSANQNVLHWAAWCPWSHSADLVEFLLTQPELDVNQRSTSGHTPLHIAAEKSLTSLALLLNDPRVNKHAKTKLGETALFSVLETRMPDRKEKMELLVRNRLDIHVRDQDGNTVLHRAAWEKEGSVLRLLLKNGALANERNSLGQTPLHLLLRGHSLYYNRDETRNYGEEIQVLLESGANPNIPDNDGYTSVHRAVNTYHTYWDIFLKYSQFPLDVNHQNNEGDTPLHLAAYASADVCQKLLQTADFSIKGRSGETVLEVRPIDEKSYPRKEFVRECEVQLESRKNKKTPNSP